MTRLYPGPLLAMAAAFALAGCAGWFNNPFSSSDPPPPAPPPAAQLSGPSRYQPQDLVGRWGYGSFQKDADRPRTEVAARGQCRQPVVVNRGPGGGVMMYVADSSQLQELVLKGGPGGRDFVGLPDQPAGGPTDREVVAFDGRVMVLRWVDPEVASRYGIGVYVRCPTPGTPTVRR